MKRPYAKPEMFCEAYELSTSIAGSCGQPLPVDERNYADRASCKPTMDGLTVFNEGQCDIDGGYDGGLFCYYTPYPETIVFTS